MHTYISDYFYYVFHVNSCPQGASLSTSKHRKILRIAFHYQCTMIGGLKWCLAWVGCVVWNPHLHGRLWWKCIGWEACVSEETHSYCTHGVRCRSAGLHTFSMLRRALGGLGKTIFVALLTAGPCIFFFSKKPTIRVQLRVRFVSSPLLILDKVLGSGETFSWPGIRLGKAGA